MCINGWVEIENRMNEGVPVSSLPKGCVVVAAQMAQLQGPGKSPRWDGLRDRQPRGKVQLSQASKYNLSGDFSLLSSGHCSLSIRSGAEATWGRAHLQEENASSWLSSLVTSLPQTVRARSLPRCHVPEQMSLLSCQQQSGCQEFALFICSVTFTGI